MVIQDGGNSVRPLCQGGEKGRSAQVQLPLAAVYTSSCNCLTSVCVSVNSVVALRHYSMSNNIILTGVLETCSQLFIFKQF